MSSSSSDSDSDEEMRARLLDAVICPKSFKSTETKIKKAQDAKIKVGPYEDIELSRMEYKRVGEILAKYTDDFFEFREPKSKTNKRLEAQENIFRFCPNHRIVQEGALIDLEPPAENLPKKTKKKKDSKSEKKEKLRQIQAIAVDFNQIRNMV